ncbi:SRPBCC family protein [Croceimicrobium sp.]|uniref:SRPBCC family protein n=1 Tax=Croceimicrobium sp. TaxID=2828340 RepID=UPI003BAD3F81
MRILKIVLFVLAGLVGLYLLISLFLPSNFDVHRTININGSKRAVFEQVNDFRNWEAWSPWLAADSTMVFKYTDDTEGEGASYSWTSENSGNGNQQILSVSGMDTINTQINFEGMDPAYGYWNFNEVANNRTEVTWGFHGELSFFSRIFGLLMDGQVGNSFETGLSNIKYIVESQKNEIVERPINEVEKDSIVYFSVTESIDMAKMADEGSALFARNYGRILAYFGASADSIISGPPFAIYHEWNEETRRATIEFCIPAQTELEASDDVDKRILATSKGLEIDYYGPYELTGQAHVQIHEHAVMNDIELAPIALEFYVTDPQTEPDTSKWLTKVYYPIL